MWHQVAHDSSRVVVVLTVAAEACTGVGTCELVAILCKAFEGPCTAWCGSKPEVPVKVCWSDAFMDLVVPLTLRVVTAVGALTHHESTNTSILDGLCRCMPADIGTALRTDLYNTLG